MALRFMLTANMEVTRDLPHRPFAHSDDLFHLAFRSQSLKKLVLSVVRPHSLRCRTAVMITFAHDHILLQISVSFSAEADTLLL